MKLYTFFRSSASFRVRIAMNYKGLKYEPAIVSLPKAEHLEAKFKSVNSQGLVPALEAELQQHVRGRLAPYEYPREIEFLDSLPMTTTGKVQRRVLRMREEERKNAGKA